MSSPVASQLFRGVGLHLREGTTKQRLGRYASRAAALGQQRPPGLLVRPLELVGDLILVLGAGLFLGHPGALSLAQDRKSTRLNSSHVAISYAVFCLKKKKK